MIPHRLYVITCSVNGKLYVGVTSRTLRDRWRGHVASHGDPTATQVLYRATRKYGIDKFKMELMSHMGNAEYLMGQEGEILATWKATKKGTRVFNIK